jgi:hypothetical protein
MLALMPALIRGLKVALILTGDPAAALALA